GRQIGAEEAEQRERHQHPAIAAILALASAEIAAAERRGDRQREDDDDEGGARRIGEERRDPAPAENGETEIGEGPDESGEGQLEGREGHGVPHCRARAANNHIVRNNPREAAPWRRSLRDIGVAYERARGVGVLRVERYEAGISSSRRSMRSRRSEIDLSAHSNARPLRLERRSPAALTQGRTL